MKEPKEPKRFKYARAVEVPRDADSRPILPLVLTDRLALVDLVSDPKIIVSCNFLSLGG